MSLAKYNQMNLSSEFRSRKIDDSIEYKVVLKDLSTTNDIAERFINKERIIREKTSLGGFRIPKETLKKRVNPSDYLEPNAGHNPTVNTYNFNEVKHLSTMGRKSKGNSLEFTQPMIDPSLNLDPNGNLSDNLIDLIDKEVAKLKKESQDHLRSLELNRGRTIQAAPIHLQEDKVLTQFMANNPDRVQAFKHVQSQIKPEYTSLEEIRRSKEELKQRLLQLENEYYERKKKDEDNLHAYSRLAEGDPIFRNIKNVSTMDNEELEKVLQYENQKFGIKSKHRAKSTRGGTRRKHKIDEPLDKNSVRYIKKFANYLAKKNVGQIQYDEEKEDWNDWNTTKIKSQNVYGVVNRPDGLPGHIDRDDYSMYYVSISSNTPRSLSIKSVTNKARSRSRSRNRSVDYTKPKNNNMPNKVLSKSFDSKLAKVNNPINNLEISSHIAFIKLIFSMLDKEKKGKVDKETIVSEIKLDDNIISDLGFQTFDNFKESLQSFRTETENFLTEEEFIGFLLSRSELAPQFLNLYKNNNNDPDNNKDYFGNLYTVDKPQVPLENLVQENFDDSEEELPGLKTNTLDFLKYDSTQERLNKLRESLGGSSISKHSKGKIHDHNTKLEKNLKSKIQKVDAKRVIVSYSDYLNFMDKYKTKSGLNITIPKPFEFLKKDYASKKLAKIEEILEERKRMEDEFLNYRFKPNELKREIFISQYENIIEAERARRKHRTDKLKERIVQEMKPFSFYDHDERRYKERISQTPQAPLFPSFRANPVKWKSQVNLYEDKIKKEELERKARVQERALKTFQAAKLPPRMEMHETNKKLMEQETKMIQNSQSKRSKSSFKANKVPDFSKLQENFIKSLEKKKIAAKPTEPMPFSFHEPKKKATLRSYMDQENDPQYKNPQFKKNIVEIIQKMQQKPKIEPASTKSLNLLMQARRKELEEKQRKEEEKILEEKLRREKQERLKERVATSKAIVDNTRELNENKKKQQDDFKRSLQEKKLEYQQELARRLQRVYNKPLMLETVTNKVDKLTLNQNMKDELNEILVEKSQIDQSKQPVDEEIEYEGKFDDIPDTS